MDTLLLSSSGFPVGSFIVPVFQLRRGECVCLHLPEAVPSVEVERLIEILTGKIAAAGIRLFGRVHWAAPLRNRRHGLWGMFRPMRAADWLSQIAGASPDQAQTILQKLQPRHRASPIQALAATPRALLSVEAAWLPEADAVVFTTIGLDPLARDAVYKAVSSHFPQGSAVHLSYPFVQNGQRQRHCFRGTRCLELIRPTGLPCPATITPRTK